MHTCAGTQSCGPLLSWLVTELALFLRLLAAAPLGRPRLLRESGMEFARSGPLWAAPHLGETRALSISSLSEGCGTALDHRELLLPLAVPAEIAAAAFGAALRVSAIIERNFGSTWQGQSSSR